MKRQLVERLKMEGKPLKTALEAVGMAKSSYYYQSVRKRKPRALDEALVKSINEARQGHAEVYGYRKVTMALRATGWTVNGKKVLTASPYPGANSTEEAESSKVEQTSYHQTVSL